MSGAAGSEPVYLCRLSDLCDGASRGFDPNDEGRDTMFLVRDGDQVRGWRNACPHYDRARMAWRKDEFLDAERRHIRCAAHGALFRLDDGLCVLGPCLGERLTSVSLGQRGDAIWLDRPYAPERHRRAPGEAGRHERQVARGGG